MDDPQIADIERAPRTRARSLYKALAARDWLGIGIELIVVTVGVLIAFQIDQWGDRQKRRQQEHQFLERLYRENGEAIDELKDVIPEHRRAMEEIGAGIRANNNPALLRAFSKRLNFGCLAGVMPSVGFNDTAYQEIVQSGKLDLVSDPQLQSMLRDLVSAQAVGGGQLDYARQVTTTNMPSVEPFYRYTIFVNDTQRPACFVDWPALVRDQRALNAAARAYRIHQLMLAVRTDALVQSEQVQRKLGCALHKTRC